MHVAQNKYNISNVTYFFNLNVRLSPLCFTAANHYASTFKIPISTVVTLYSSPSLSLFLFFTVT